MKIITLYTLIAIISNTVSFSQSKISDFSIDTSLCEGQILFKKKFIPKPFYDEYKRITDIDFKIVNPNRNIQKSDIIRFYRKPLKRLLFIIKNGDAHLIVFERGGGARGVSFIFFEYSDSKISNMNFIYFSFPTDVNRICEQIRKKDYIIDNNSIP